MCQFLNKAFCPPRVASCDEEQVADASPAPVRPLCRDLCVTRRRSGQQRRMLQSTGATAVWRSFLCRCRNWLEDVGSSRRWTWHFTPSRDLFPSGSSCFSSFVSLLPGHSAPLPALPSHHYLFLQVPTREGCSHRHLMSEGNSPGNSSNVEKGA